MSVEFTRTIPILRIVSVEKAEELCIGWLGCKVDWEHQLEQKAPNDIRVSRAHLVLHLGEHHGDACPGQLCRLKSGGLRSFTASSTKTTARG